jgi:hypothetical protein
VYTRRGQNMARIALWQGHFMVWFMQGVAGGPGPGGVPAGGGGTRPTSQPRRRFSDSEFPWFPQA